MEMKGMLNAVLDKLESHLNTSIIFGESREVYNRTFIPVTAVSFGFGFGSGVSRGKRKKEQPALETEPQDILKAEEQVEPVKKLSTNSGGGGGGGGKAVPLGMFEVSDEYTRFIPVIDAKHILALCGMVTVLILKMHRKKGQKKPE